MENPPLPTNSNASKQNQTRLMGALVLAGSLALVYFWLQGFLTFTIELPANGIGVPNLCIWQYTLSTDLIWSGNTAIPFLAFLLLSALNFLLRLARKRPNTNLPLEFGLLNLLFAVGGTGLFMFFFLIYTIILLIPGAETLSLHVFGCKPTDAFLPGMAALGISTVMLFAFQGTGWLHKPSTEKHR